MSPVLSQKQRRNVIRDNIARNTYDELASLCGVTKRTIRRDVAKWKDEGGYDEFLMEEFFKLYGLVKVKDVKHAFDRICDLIRRRWAEAAVTRIEGPIEIMWKEHDSETGDSIQTS